MSRNGAASTVPIAGFFRWGSKRSLSTQLQNESQNGHGGSQFRKEILVGPEKIKMTSCYFDPPPLLAIGQRGQDSFDGLHFDP